MAVPSLLFLPTESDYRLYFIENFCNQSPIMTWDGLPVMFYPDMFEHAFYKRASKAWKAPKTSLDQDRCERMMWIKDVLSDSTIIPREGYDKDKNVHDRSRRVAFLSKENYLVVIRDDNIRWRFVTAFIVDDAATAAKILSSPAWKATILIRTRNG